MKDTTQSRLLTGCVFSTIAILLLLLCGGMVVLGATMLAARNLEAPAPDPVASPTFAPTVAFDTPPATTEGFIVPTEALETLERTVIPESDLRDLARRLLGKDDIPETLDPPAAALEIGERQLFWASNLDTAENFQVDAVLRYRTPHVYFWVQQGLRYDPDDLALLVETFEREIYPLVRSYFGSEWTPGIDGDRRIYILFAAGLGRSVAAYFSSADEIHPLAHPYSNGHEMFFVNADTTGLEEDFTYAVLAHEMQHMIHWNRDRNESLWMNEGFSELAMLLSGYDVAGVDTRYLTDPDIQLNAWPTEGSADAHYGASFLFMTYFLDRFGRTALQSLVAQEANGLHSIDLLFAEMNLFDVLRGRGPTAEDLFQDWTLATYLQDRTVADGRFTYSNYPGLADPALTETIWDCPTDPQSRLVHQFGVDYIRLACRGDFTLHFEGAPLVPLLPADPYSGTYVFWSNEGEESDMTLTRRFDFSGTGGPLTLTYWTWFDIEAGYDFVYLEASTDGESWEILRTPSGTDSALAANNYGWAYTGRSKPGDGWIQEQVDLSRFAGQQVWIRFEYITDIGKTGHGFLLDDVSIPEVGYFSDFELDAGGWQASGFVRVPNLLPQSFRVALIESGDLTEVTYLTPDAENAIEVDLQIGGDVDEVILVVSATTRFTRQPGVYQFALRRPLPP